MQIAHTSLFTPTTFLSVHFLYASFHCLKTSDLITSLQTHRLGREVAKAHGRHEHESVVAALKEAHRPHRSVNELVLEPGHVAQSFQHEGRARNVGDDL